MTAGEGINKQVLLLLAAMGVAVLLALAAASCGAGGGGGAGFGTGGKTRTDFGGADGALAVAIQRDGKIVAAGVGKTDFALARYTDDGRLDPSFGSGGKVRTDFGGSDRAFAVAIQRDGKIVAVGMGNRHFALARYRPDGSLDRSFGTGGKIVTTFPSAPGTVADGKARAADVALQPDGRIVAAGSSNSDGVVARYTATGRLDPSFGRGGKVVTHLFCDVTPVVAVTVQSDGKIIAGIVTYPHCGSWLVRFTRTGNRDRSFGRGGEARFDAKDAEETWVSAVATQSDGTVVASGGAWIFPPTGDYVFALARYTQAGRLDPIFGRAGKPVTGGGYSIAIAVQADGKIVVAGADFVLARYTTGGQLDPDFGTHGKVAIRIGNAAAVAVAVQADGKIVAAGGSGRDFLLVRYNTDGSLDS